MIDLEQAIRQYGYWAIFAGTILEGETALLLGSMAAGGGLLNPLGVALSAWLGGCLGDWFFYFLGLKGGRGLLAKAPRLSLRTEKLRGLIKRRATLIILSSRFAYGLRSLIPPACAASGVPASKYLPLNLASGLAWCSFYSLLGAGLGRWLVQYLSSPEKMGVLLIALVLFMLLGSLAARAARRGLSRGPRPSKSTSPDGLTG